MIDIQVSFLWLRVVFKAVVTESALYRSLLQLLLLVPKNDYESWMFGFSFDIPRHKTVGPAVFWVGYGPTMRAFYLPRWMARRLW